MRPFIGGPSWVPEKVRAAERAVLESPSGSLGVAEPRFLGRASVERRVDTLKEAGRFVVQLTNQRREAHGLDPITPDSGLTRTACTHSRDMLFRDFVAHENPDGQSPADRVSRWHRRLIGPVAENVWSQTGGGPDRNRPEPLAERIVEGWMDSPPHRHTLLDSTGTHLGVCVVREGTRFRATQIVASVHAYLADPVPYRVEVGDELPVSVTGTSGPGVKRYDLVRVDTDRRASGPFSYDDTLRVPFEEGRYRIRFYLPDSYAYREFEGVYRGYRGPEIQVVSSS